MVQRTRTPPAVKKYKECKGLGTCWIFKLASSCGCLTPQTNFTTNATAFAHLKAVFLLSEEKNSIFPFLFMSFFY